MPVWHVWMSRPPPYRAGLLVLTAVLPASLLSTLLPYWLELNVLLPDASDVHGITVPTNYGLWTLCAEQLGCHHVHSQHVNLDAGVGGWLHSVAVFSVLSSLLHSVSVFCGVLQNFATRNIMRRGLAYPLLRSLLHRDAAWTEDLAFVAGALGMVAHIVFMVCTKDQVTEGASYSWSFALGFMASSFTVVASLVLTKAHALSSPRPPRRPRPYSFQPQEDSHPTAPSVEAATLTAPQVASVTQPVEYSPHSASVSDSGVLFRGHSVSLPSPLQGSAPMISPQPVRSPPHQTVQQGDAVLFSRSLHPLGLLGSRLWRRGPSQPTYDSEQVLVYYRQTDSVHAPPRSSHASLRSGHALSRSSHSPSRTSHAPSRSSHRTSHSYRPPSWPGYAPSNVGHAPSNVGRTPSNSGHPPSNVGHVPSNVDHTLSSVGHASTGSLNPTFQM